MAIEASDIENSVDLIDFIEKCPSMFHTVATVRARLDAEGFEYLPESAEWTVERGGSYYTVRNGSSIIAWKVGEALEGYHFQMTAAHSDSPTFKVKAVPELEGPGEYLRLNVEAYGGMIDNTWLDRPLGVAGRVLVKDGDKIESRLVHVEQDVLLIPNLAIHMNREANNGFKLNRQVDLSPLFSAGELKRGDFDRMIAEQLEVDPEQILGKDLFLVNHQEGKVWGYGSEFISAPKLDDLQCAYVSMEAFLGAANPNAVSVCAIFDNEEVGSNTKQGAMSTFLHDTLVRVNGALGFDQPAYLRALAKSFLVSCDNAHAVHPNHAEKTDEANRVFMNRGIVIKEAANQKYTTDAFSRAVFAQVCERAGVPTQAFANRSDSAGGSTLGNLSNIQVSVHALDIGLPQLAMHSSYETAGTKDTTYAIDALTMFFNTDIQIDGSDSVSFV